MNRLWSIQPIPLEFGEGQPIQIMRVGKWKFHDYGEVNVTQQTIRNIVLNFKRNIRKQKIPINIEHVKELGKIGYIKEVYASDNGNSCYVLPEWTEKGQKLMEEHSFSYSSPEYFLQWEDPETQKKFDDVLSGLAVTNYPRFKGMEEIAASEAGMIAVECEEISIDPQYISDTLTFSNREAIGDHVSIMAMLLATADDNTSVKHTPQSVRDTLPESAFAFVGKRKILINHRGNVESGIARFKEVQDVSDDERDAAWTRLKRAAAQFGMTCPDSWRDIGKKPEKMMSDVIRQIFIPTVENSMTAKEITSTESVVLDQKFAEMQAKLEATEADKKLISAKFAEMETTIQQQQQLLASEKSARIAVEISKKLDEAKHKGVITPAQAELYMTEMPKMTDTMRDLWFMDIMQRPVVLSLAEMGSGEQSDDDADDLENTKLAKRAKAIESSEKISYREALRKARLEQKSKGEK